MKKIYETQPGGGERSFEGEMPPSNDLRKALDANREKGLFIGVITHELRTPLSIILGAAELLETGGGRISASEMANYVQSIKRAARRMAHTIDSVLTFGMAQGNRLPFRPSNADVAATCQKIAKEMEELHDGRRITLQISSDFPRMISVDTTLLGHIVANLLGNALKYSSADKAVILRLANGTNSIAVEVQDFGIGIPAADIDHVFGAFQRGSNVGNRQGTGIGASIVKHCVALHGGEISIESVEGIGSTFRVRLPIQEPQPQHTA
jgi:signal transduction histidine kinase